MKDVTLTHTHLARATQHGHTRTHTHTHTTLQRQQHLILRHKQMIERKHVISIRKCKTQLCKLAHSRYVTYISIQQHDVSLSSWCVCEEECLLLQRIRDGAVTNRTLGKHVLALLEAHTHTHTHKVHHISTYIRDAACLSDMWVEMCAHKRMVISKWRTAKRAAGEIRLSMGGYTHQSQHMHSV